MNDAPPRPSCSCGSPASVIVNNIMMCARCWMARYRKALLG